MLYKVVLTWVCGWNPKVWSFIMNATYWAVLSCATVCFVVQDGSNLSFESLYEILKCDHSNESYCAVLSCGYVYYAAQGGSNFSVCGWNLKASPLKWKLLSSALLWCCSLCLSWRLSFVSVDTILKCAWRAIQMKDTEKYFSLVLRSFEWSVSELFKPGFVSLFSSKIQGRSSS